MTRDEAFTSCLLIYGPRPSKRQPNFRTFLDALFKWDADVMTYLLRELGHVEGVPSEIRKLYAEYLTWLEDSNEQ